MLNAWLLFIIAIVHFMSTWDLLYASNRLIDSSWNLQRDSCIPKALPADQSQPTSSGYANYYAAIEWSITRKQILKTFSTSGLRLITWLASLSGRGMQSSLVKSTGWWSEVNISAIESLRFLLSSRLWTCKIVCYVNFI